MRGEQIMEQRYLRCKKCSNIIALVRKNEKDIICCGEPMVLLEANTVDAAFEKHIPVVEEKENVVQVRVGEVIHPMTNEHYIEFIVLHTDQGYKIKHLYPGDVPAAEFAIKENEIVFSAYAYCNLHGLWKKNIE